MAQFIPVYGALTGGGTGALDAIYAGGESGYYSALAAGDVAIVHNSGDNRVYIYRFYVAGSAQTESSPAVIKPDNQSSGNAYTGKGAWLLVDIAGGGLFAPLTYSEVSVTGAVTAAVGKMHVCSDSGTPADYTVTLPAVSGNTGKMIGFRMSSALTKLVTLDGNSSETIDGAATRIMWAGETAILLCDGTEWKKIAGRSIPMVSGLHLDANQNSITSGQWVIVNLDESCINAAPAAMQDIANHRLKILRPSIYDFKAMVLPNGPLASNTMFLVLGINGSISTDTTRYQEGNAGNYPLSVPINGSLNASKDDLITLLFEYTAGSCGLIGDSGNMALSNFLILTETLLW